jgi:hypothetical protein
MDAQFVDVEVLRGTFLVFRQAMVSWARGERGCASAERRRVSRTRRG